MNQPKTPRRKTIFNDWRQPLPSTLEPIEGGKFPATCMFDLTNAGKIVFKINDGIYKEGSKATHKEVEMNVVDRHTLFDTIYEAATNPSFQTSQFSIKKRQYVFSGGASKLSDAPITLGTFTINRTANGRVTMDYSKGDYKVPLVFKGAYDSVIMVRTEEGPKKDEGLLSRSHARAWVNFHRPLLDQLEADNYVPPKPKDGGNSNNGAGNTSQRDNSFNNNDDFDEDIMF